MSSHKNASILDKEISKSELLEYFSCCKTSKTSKRENNKPSTSSKITPKKRKLQMAAAGSPKLTAWFIDLSSSIQKNNDPKIKVHNFLKDENAKDIEALSSNLKTKSKIKEKIDRNCIKLKNVDTKSVDSKKSPFKPFRKRRIREATGSPKITAYFAKKPRVEENEDGKKKNRGHTKSSTKITKETSEKVKKSPTKTKSRSNIQSKENKTIKTGKKSVEGENSNEVVKKPRKRVSDSFRKYGVHIPSFSEILRDNKKLMEYSAKVTRACNLVEEKSKIIREIPLPTFELDDDEPLLGCEDLTRENIKEAFFRNKQHCIDIMTEKLYSERHYKFKSMRNTSELIINIVSEVFSVNQMNLLAKLCFKHLADYFSSNIDPYCFKVLLPELCLKIFMDTHNMTQEDAIKYLDKRPVTDL